MNVLIAGIPVPGLVAHIRAQCRGDLELFVAESRPFERSVAQAIAALRDSGIEVTVLTDNMVGALLKTHDIEAIWSLYTGVADGKATAINGAHVAALLARERGIPFRLFPTADLPEVEPGCFASQPIRVPGASYIDYAPDTVPIHLVTEVIEHGS
jgi:methylthioribose-1-phosphate isomerase